MTGVNRERTAAWASRVRRELDFCEQQAERHKCQIHLFMQIISEHRKKWQGITGEEVHVC